MEDQTSPEPDPDFDPGDDEDRKDTTIEKGTGFYLTGTREERLAAIRELVDEGWSNADIGERLGLNEQSVRGILSKANKAAWPPPLESSLRNSLTNHTPSEEKVRAIETIRVEADRLCQVIDQMCPSSREAALAKTHLEETVMWAVKSIVLPREETTVTQRYTGATVTNGPGEVSLGGRLNIGP